MLFIDTPLWFRYRDKREQISQVQNGHIYIFLLLLRRCSVLASSSLVSASVDYNRHTQRQTQAGVPLGRSLKYGCYGIKPEMFVYECVFRSAVFDTEAVVARVAGSVRFAVGSFILFVIGLSYSHTIHSVQG
jgi:hypothetical protein